MLYLTNELKTRLRASQFVAVSLVAACSGGSEATTSTPPPSSAPARVATVTISPDTARLEITKSVQLNVDVRDAAGSTMTGRNVSWTSSDTNTVSVSSAGVATARAVGGATVSAAVEGVTAAARVLAISPVRDSAVVAGAGDSVVVRVGEGSQVSFPSGALPVGATVILRETSPAPEDTDGTLGAALELTLRMPSGGAPNVSPRQGGAVAPLSFTVTTQIPSNAVPAPAAGTLGTVVSLTAAGSTVPGPVGAPSGVVAGINAVGRSVVSVSTKVVTTVTGSASWVVNVVVVPNDCAPAIVSERFYKARSKSDRTPDPRRIPLVLVHGWQPLMRTCGDVPMGFGRFAPESDTWDELLSQYMSAPDATSASLPLDVYEPWVMRYPTFQGIEQSSQELVSAMQATFGSRSAVVVAHSMGGLVAGRAMVRETALPIGKLVTLGTPWSGTPLAASTFSQLRWTFDVRLCTLIQSGATALVGFASTPGFDDLSDEAQGWIAQSVSPHRGLISARVNAIAGDIRTQHIPFELAATLRVADCMLRLLGIAASDGVVPVQSALAGASATAVKTLQGLDHIALPAGVRTSSGESALQEVESLLRAHADRHAPVETISIASGTGIIPLGGTLQLSAKPRDVAGYPLTGRTITWASSSAAVVAVDPTTGIARGVSLGPPVTVTATAGGKTATVALSVSSTAPPSTPPGLFAPYQLTAAITAGPQVALAWRDTSSSENGFQIERAIGAGTFATIGATATNLTSYTDKGVTPGGVYAYRVRSFNANGGSGYSNLANVSVPSGPCATPQTISRNIDTATTLVSGPPGCAHYRVVGRLSVSGALSIQPGTVVAMAAGAGLKVFGSLSAVGAPGQPIEFRGEQAVRGYWEAIEFASQSPLNELRYVEVRHGGGGTAAVRANVLVGGSDVLSVHASRFEESAGAGLWIHDLAILRGFSANSFRANALSGLHISAEHIGALDAASVYADSNGTPFVDVEGTQVRQTQAWSVAGVPLRMTGVTTIRSDVSIGPGVQLWMGQSASFVVWGSLSAVGSPEARITIRGEQPLRGYWQSIMFGSKSALNRMTEVSVRHGGGTTNRLAGSITVANNSLLQIERTDVEESATAGVWVDDFAELRTWTANVLRNNAGAGLHLPAEQVGALDAASSYLDGNGSAYIEVEGGTVARTQVWRATGAPLHIKGVTTIQGALTIAPGVVAWMAQGALIHVYGSLVAIGTPSARITFRGYAPLRGYWQTIHFNTSSSLCEFAFVDVLHAGGPSPFFKAAISLSSGVRFRLTNSTIAESAGWGLFANPPAAVTPSPLAAGGNVFTNNALGAANIP